MCIDCALTAAPTVRFSCCCQQRRTLIKDAGEEKPKILVEHLHQDPSRGWMRFRVLDDEEYLDHGSGDSLNVVHFVRCQIAGLGARQDDPNMPRYYSLSDFLGTLNESEPDKRLVFADRKLTFAKLRTASDQWIAKSARGANATSIPAMCKLDERYLLALVRTQAVVLPWLAE